MIKKGDNVRFLNAVGGGIVTRVDENKKMVYVEDGDGFEMPVQERECVLIEAINKETNFPIRDFKTKTTAVSAQMAREPESAKTEPAKAEPIVETPEGENMVALLAFFPDKHQRNANDVVRMLSGERQQLLPVLQCGKR